MAGFVGLDVGTMAVRAAEVTLRDQVPSLELFGQVALPYGAVRNGEVVDVGAVGEAIQRLWSQTGFKTKKVVVGLANQRVFVRQAELPAMAEEEIRSALQFEAQEFIPIPIEDVELDFRVIESVVGADGEPKVRILLAAAQKDMVRNLLAAVELAGLRATKVDLIPFALVRALSPLSYAVLGDSENAEAIVSIGAGITNVVVHERGVPRFVRILTMGGGSVTEAIAESLSVDMDSAEELKRYSYMRPSDPNSTKVAEVVEAQVRPLLQEIQGSLQFYSSQADAAPLARVLVAGGGSLTPGLFDRLTAQSSVPVQPALILGSLHLGRTGLSEQDLTRSEPVMAPPLGLALAPYDSGAISLLPHDLAHRANTKVQSALAAGLILLLLLLLFTIWHSKQSKLDSLTAANAKAQTINNQIESSLPNLHASKALAQQNQQSSAMVKGVLSNDIDWVQLLGGIAVQMPQDSWMTTLTMSNSTAGATAGPSAAGSAAPASTSTTASGTSLGTISIGVNGVNFGTAAQWMEQFSPTSFEDLSGMWIGAIRQQPVADLYSGAQSAVATQGNASAGSATPSSSSSATSNSSQNNSFGVTTPNIDPSIAFCLIPGHCYSSFTATATITSNALSTRVNCYINGFTSSSCPEEQILGSGS